MAESTGQPGKGVVTASHHLVQTFVDYLNECFPPRRSWEFWEVKRPHLKVRRDKLQPNSAPIWSVQRPELTVANGNK